MGACPGRLPHNGTLRLAQNGRRIPACWRMFRAESLLDGEAMEDSTAIVRWSESSRAWRLQS
jgi:hypothetical protein